jgi:NhaA family Na+:H+ antiporter
MSNSPWSHQFLTFWELPVGIQIGSLEAARSLRDWVNDGLMTLFFFVVALELKRELVLGELRNPRTAALSIAAAAGGMLVPAVLYLVLQWGRDGAHGWGVVMATDTAFVIGCLAVFGRRIPQSLRVFMLSRRSSTTSAPFWSSPSATAARSIGLQLLSAGSASRSFAGWVCSGSEAFRSTF